MTNQAVILIVMAGYMLMIIAIGILFARRSNKNAESYFLGGRTLGPWVSAMSAEASDMSGYLLMGVPGLLVRPGGCWLDGDWPGAGHVLELAAGIAPPAQLFRGRWQCHYRAGFPQQSFS